MAVPAVAATAPGIFPTPHALDLTGGEFNLGDTVVLVRKNGVDAAVAESLEQTLTKAGVRRIIRKNSLPHDQNQTVIVTGLASEAVVKDALAKAQASVPDLPESYVLAARSSLGEGMKGKGLVILAGRDAAGLLHAAQTFRQTVRSGSIASLTVVDYPSMPVRGTIEGFYGKPWTMAERANHIRFLASMKANTFIYSPKDDVFARDKWREPYPAETLDALGNLARLAGRVHINFVYAVSPGPSICYSDPADVEAIRSKFASLRRNDVESFYVAFDDIEYTKWNCASDEAKFGAPGQKAAAQAQAGLLNTIQEDLAKSGHGSLIMVPTEYYNTTETPYKAALREALDPRVVVQWTGTDVVPASISVNHAKDATRAFGRKTLLWDNYPVNDFKESEGRLLLAPYDYRQAGLSQQLTGIVANPMNQEVSSRPAVAGLLSFAWNDADYDAQRTWSAAARELAGGNEQITQALLTFFDTQHLAPTFGHLPWQPQAPRLKARIDAVRDALAYGDAAEQEATLRDLAQAADALAAAPDVIRAGVVEPGFIAEAKPWLEATQLWARALQLSVHGLEAELGATSAAAPRFFNEAERLARQAAAIEAIPGATRFVGPVKVADGVLDRFVKDAPQLVRARQEQ
jgi:hyaluronoglucosaminidase